MTNHSLNTEQRELAACPFCGSPAKAFGAYDAWAVNCTSCNAYGPSACKADAIERWNRRATQAAPASPEPAKCECGKNEWRDYYTGPRITHHICIACGFKFPTTQPVFPVPQYRGEISKIEWSEITPGAVHRVASDRAPASPNTGAAEDEFPQVERVQINLMELVEDSERNQPCAHGSLVDGHAVYCHNGKWPDAPRKCRRTWYTGGETRDEDCEGFAPNPKFATPSPSKGGEACTLCDGTGSLDASGAICPHCNRSGIEPSGEADSAAMHQTTGKDDK